MDSFKAILKDLFSRNIASCEAPLFDVSRDTSYKN